MRVHCRWLLVPLVLATVALAAARQVPPIDEWPHTRAEWEAKEAEPQRQAGPFPEAYPEFAPEWDAYRSRMETMAAKYQGDRVVYTPELADQLVDELYVDNGHPILNGGFQDYALDMIREVAWLPEERLPESARDRLLAGLREYISAGGGRWAPVSMTDAAAALARLEDRDPEAYTMANGLLAEALVWQTAVMDNPERSTVYKTCQRFWGDIAAVRLHEAQALAQEALPPEAAKSPRYLKAVERLTALLEKTPSDRGELVRSLHAATDAALEKFEPAALEDDLTARLLITYDRLLARRPQIPERASDYIGNQLLRMAARSERVRTDKHWQLWTKAAKALGTERIPRHFKSYVKSALDAKDLPENRRKAFEPLKPLLTE